MANILTSLHGEKLGLAADGSLVNGAGTQITHPAVDAVITVGAEASNVRAITVQLNDAEGNPITSRAVVKAHVLLDANGDAFAATGGSTGIEIGTDGALLAVVAKKSFILISEADGDIDLTWTDTGTEAAFLGIELPNGRLVISSAMTNT